MPRYFFNARRPDGLLPDPEGEDLPDLTAARAMAADVAREMARNAPPEMWSGWSLEIADETGLTVLMLPFSDLA